MPERTHPFRRLLLLGSIVLLLFSAYVLRQHMPLPEEKSQDIPPKQKIQTAIPQPEKTQPSEAERAKANAILAFCNLAEKNAAEPWCSQADSIAFFLRIYLGEWQLPKFTAIPFSQELFRKKLLPKADLFPKSVEDALAKNISTMASSLEEMRKTYTELTSYVQDSSLADDGVRGKRLANAIKKSYARFVQARKEYFLLLEKEAVPAENMLLEGFPLKRQILQAREIFTTIRAISFELSQEKTDIEKIRTLEENLSQLCTAAEQPPFKGKASSERLFRIFLRNVRIYLGSLHRGNSEGFYPNVRKLLNDDIANCRSSYNDFAKHLNTQ